MNWFDSTKEILAKWKTQELSGRNNFQKFTPRAQQVLNLARKEAERLKNNFVGTEHILIGLITLGQGVAANVLIKQGFTLEAVREQIERDCDKNPEQIMFNRIPYTPRAKRVIEQAEKEAKTFQHTYVGTEHLFLGLLKENDGPASLILKNLGMDIEQTQKEIQIELFPKFSPNADAQKAQE